MRIWFAMIGSLMFVAEGYALAGHNYRMAPVAAIVGWLFWLLSVYSKEPKK